MRRGSLALLVAGAVALAGCGGSDSTSSTTSSAAKPTLPAGCQRVPRPKPRSVHLKRPPLNTVRRGERLTARVETSCGSFAIALDSAAAPKTVSSFVYLARRGFYDGLSFDRVVPNFLIQGGNPRQAGLGGPGYRVVEPPPPGTTYRRGVVAMAKTPIDPPGSSGSQFFVVTAPADAGLQPVYALLGRVSSGMSTVKRIASLANPAAGREGGEPADPVVIRRVTIH